MNTTPQGWYRDPADRTRVRWFDGQTWTASIQAAPEPGSAPLQPPTPAELASATRPRAAVATLPARADDVPSPHAPAGMVIPELEPDDPEEFEDEYWDEEPAATPEPEPVVDEQPAAAQEQYPPQQPYEQPAYAQPDPQLGQAFAPATGVPQQFSPAPLPPQEPSIPYAQYGSEYAPAPVAQPELPPYVAQPFAPTPAPFGPPPAAFGPPAAPFGQAPAAYPPPPTGAAPGYAPPGPGWQGGPQQWEQPPAKKKSGAKVVLIVLGSVVVGLVLLGILAAIAIPVFLNQRDKAEVAGLGLDAVTCEQVSEYAVQISDAGQSQGVGPLVSMTDVALSQDNRASVRVPAKGQEPAFVLSCIGTGTKPDGTTAPVTANLYIDSSTQQLVAYAWDE